ncbi:MAG TPA: ABC transporter substrate-binding protein [Vineibacter sp.]|nr:ABC transporter substrate-binding protein [Vineibacter sp.]
MRRHDFIRLSVGFAAALPFAANGQQTGRRYRISFLALVPGEDKTLMKALLERLHELGYSETTNMIFKYASAEGHPERLASLAKELVDDKPDVLIAGFGTLAAQAAKAATTTIPVVFATVGDPLGAGIVTSLARPGGNITGLTDQAKDVQGKRLQLLLEFVPGKHQIAVLMNPDTPFSRLALEEAKAAANQRSIQLDVLEARTPEQILQRMQDATTATAAALLVLEDPLIYSIRGKIADRLVQLRLPSIFVYRDSAEAGGLMSYGPDRQHLYRRAAEYVDRILKGAKPGDLPVEQPTKFEFVINLNTAKLLDLAIPAALLVFADDVIR